MTEGVLTALQPKALKNRGLQRAAERGNTEKLHRYLGRGANPEAAIDQALGQHDRNALSVLLQGGADARGLFDKAVRARNLDGTLAAMQHDPALERLALDQGPHAAMARKAAGGDAAMLQRLMGQGLPPNDALMVAMPAHNEAGVRAALAHGASPTLGLVLSDAQRGFGRALVNEHLSRPLGPWSPAASRLAPVGRATQPGFRADASSSSGSLPPHRMPQAAAVGRAGDTPGMPVPQHELDRRLDALARRGDLHGMREVLDHGADANTALAVASHRHDEAALHLLLQQGANPDTALNMAMRESSAVCMRVALAHGASANAAMHAAAARDERAVLVLLQHGANPNHPDASGQTPADTASRHRKLKVILTLERAPGFDSSLVRDKARYHALTLRPAPLSPQARADIERMASYADQDPDSVDPLDTSRPLGAR